VKLKRKLLLLVVVVVVSMILELLPKLPRSLTLLISPLLITLALNNLPRKVLPKMISQDSVISEASIIKLPNTKNLLNYPNLNKKVISRILLHSIQLTSSI